MAFIVPVSSELVGRAAYGFRQTASALMLRLPARTCGHGGSGQEKTKRAIAGDIGQSGFREAAGPCPSRTDGQRAIRRRASSPPEAGLVALGGGCIGSGTTDSERGDHFHRLADRFLVERETGGDAGHERRSGALHANEPLHPRVARVYAVVSTPTGPTIQATPSSATAHT